MKRKNVLGIDLGTTFSSISVIKNEKPILVADNINRKDIPSIINFYRKSKDFEITVGNIAKKRQARNTKMTVYDSKRMLGRKFKDEQIQKLKNSWPFNIEESESGGILICLEGVEKKYHPFEISGEILKYLAEIGNSRFPVEERTKDVIITIPANFGDEQRTETIKAAEYAGLHVLQLINEPTAAGLAFGLQNQISKSRYIFVFDFGGGTLDVSLLEQKGKNIEVKATDGDMFLGGRDFDENTMNFLIKEYDLDESFCNNHKRMNKLREAVIVAKYELSNTNTAVIAPDDDELDEYEMSLEKFEEINQNLIDKILIPVERLLNSQEINKKQVDSIILVGGSSNMSFVKRKLTSYFGKEPYKGVDPEEAVAIGAGIVASKYIDNIDPDSLIKIIEYQDICSFSIGTSDIDGTMTKLIYKGSKIPTPERTESFHTVYYRQETFPVDIYEGENKYVKDNFFLGDFSVSNLPPSEDQIEFIVTFSMDKNGILIAKAQLKNSDLSAETKIEVNKIKPTIAEIQKEDKEFQSYLLNPLIRDSKIFFQNILRFIQLNRKSFEKEYGSEITNQFIDEIKYKIDNVATEYAETIYLIRDFNKKFYKYLKNHKKPQFLDEDRYL